MTGGPKRAYGVNWNASASSVEADGMVFVGALRFGRWDSGRRVLFLLDRRNGVEYPFSTDRIRGMMDSLDEVGEQDKQLR